MRSPARDDTVAKEQDAKSEPDRKEPQGSEVAGEQAGVAPLESRMFGP